MSARKLLKTFGETSLESAFLSPESILLKLSSMIQMWLYLKREVMTKNMALKMISLTSMAEMATSMVPLKPKALKEAICMSLTYPQTAHEPEIIFRDLQ
jgi:hypothetical protein